MTALDAPVAAGRAVKPGTRSFTAILAMCIAATALAIDTALPAFADIRAALGLSPDDTSVARVITIFMLGSSAGLLPAGVLADRFGRKRVMWGGLALYVAGGIGALLAPSLAWMLVARFVWGLGSAGPRVAAIAMVRDAYAGEQMARQMSFVMAVFIIVPTFAPLLSTGVLTVASWEWVFGGCAVAGVLVAFAVARLPETLAPEHSRRLAPRDVGAAARAVIATPGTIGYLLALSALFSAFLAYLAGCEVIIDQVFHQARYFWLFFGSASIVMGIGMWVNGRLVERVGLDKMSAIVFAVSIAATAAQLALAWATDGQPPLWSWVICVNVMLFAHQMLIPNLNAAAMRPLARVAGTAAAILGMVPGVVGSIVGGMIVDRFDDTITPFAIACLLATIVAAAAWQWARRSPSPRGAGG